MCIAHDPGVRLRDIATMVGITERSAYSIVNDLASAGYVVKDKTGRRNRYEIQAHLPLGEAVGQERTIGEVLEVLVNTNSRRSQAADLQCEMGARTHWLIAGRQAPSATAGLFPRSLAALD